MAHDTAALLDAFAELRRTWDELISLQPDIVDLDLALLSERVSAHVVAAVALEDQIEIMRAEEGGAS